MINGWSQASGVRSQERVDRITRRHRVFGLAVCAYFSTLCFTHAGTQTPRSTMLFDIPTAEIVDYYGYDMSFRFYSTGGVLGKTYFGVLPRLNIGFGIDTERLIGTESPHLNKPTVNIKYRFFDGSRRMPALAIGYDGQGFHFDNVADRYRDREKGLYLVGSNEVFVPNLELHTGLNVFDFNKDKFFFFTGVSYLIENKLQIMAEYDNVHSTPKNRINTGLRFFITPGISVDLAGRDIGSSNSERIVIINHTGKF